MSELPSGWRAIGGAEAKALDAELRRELPAAHVLAGRSVHAIARRDDQDDVLFEDGDHTVYFVHLTYSAETDPQWPFTERYDDVNAFRESHRS